MARRNTKNNNLATITHCFILGLSLICPLLSIADAISFNVTDFTNWGEIGLAGDANINSTTGVLTLTGDPKIDSVGRAVFAEALRVWDAKSGATVDFDTTFSFAMKPGTTTLGDGFAFFLEWRGSRIPSPYAWGECLGLISYCENSTAPNGLIAVEFDGYENEYDPSGNHIGINVNSIHSDKTVTLKTPWAYGARGVARVWYSSLTNNLSVLVTYLDQNYELSHPVNISAVLLELVNFGFSGATGYAKAAYEIYSWKFDTTEQLRKSVEESKKGGKGSVNLVLLLSCTVGGSFLVFGIALFFYLSCTRKTSAEREMYVKEKICRPEVLMDREFEHETGPKSFSYEELVKATDLFSAEGKLGEGGFGEVYRGYLKDSNLSVAVKRLSKRSKQGIKEYISEVKIISKLRHRHLVKLLGWCHENGEFLLVYEFLHNGSLDSHLFGSESEIILSWEIRYKAVRGLASALFYLHEESGQYSILHRDIKSSNVMLDSNFNAKLGDFGLARLADEVAGQRTTGLAGTLGYLAPEYVCSGKASKASDVYSFGVVMLEIACGRKSVEHSFEEDKVSLVAWVWECYGNGKLVDVVDRRLGSEFDAKEAVVLLTVGLWCVHPDHKARPSVNKIIMALGFEAPLPFLSKKMPVANYDSPFKSVPSSTSGPSISYSSINIGR